MNSPDELVLVVDDDRSVRKSLERLLRSHGYYVETFSSAEEFLDEVPPAVPTCAILDLAMPGLNGLELQQQLLERKEICGIVFLTGHGDLESGVEAMKKGAVDFLSKPIDEERLLEAVRESLTKQKSRLQRIRSIDDAKRRLQGLTPREYDVMELVVTGRLNKLIAAELGISEKTVKAHRANVMRKTGVKSVADLVRLFIASNETDEDSGDGRFDRG